MYREIEEEFKNSNYFEFKNAVSDSLEKLIVPIQEKYKIYRNSSELIQTLKDGSKEASIYVSQKLEEVKNKLGINYF